MRKKIDLINKAKDLLRLNLDENFNFIFDKLNFSFNEHKPFQVWSSC